MNQYLIMCRSMTRAQQSKNLLERSGISASVTKAPQKLTSGGCGYAVSLYRSVDTAIRLLKENNMLSGKIFKKTDSGEYEEIRA